MFCLTTQMGEVRGDRRGRWRPMEQAARGHAEPSVAVLTAQVSLYSLRGAQLGSGQLRTADR